MNQLIPSLLPTATGTQHIDPVQQGLMYGNIAQGQTGAFNAVTNALASRGLGHSGLLGGALTQIGNQAQSLRNQSDLGLQQQAFQQKQLSIQDLLGLLGTPNVPGQSGLGGFLAGMAPIAAYSIQNALNNNTNSGLPVGGTPGMQQGALQSFGQVPNIYNSPFPLGTPPFLG